MKKPRRQTGIRSLLIALSFTCALALLLGFAPAGAAEEVSPAPDEEASAPASGSAQGQEHPEDGTGAASGVEAPQALPPAGSVEDQPNEEQSSLEESLPCGSETQPAQAPPAAAPAAMALADAADYPLRYEWSTAPVLAGSVIPAQVKGSRVEATLPGGLEDKTVTIAFTPDNLGNVIRAMGAQYGLDYPGWSEMVQGYILNDTAYDYQVAAIYLDPSTPYHFTAPLNLSPAMMETLQANPAYADFYLANQTAVDGILSTADARTDEKALVESLAAELAVPGGHDGYTRLLLDTYAPGGLTPEAATAMANAIFFTTPQWTTGLYANHNGPLQNAGQCLLTDLASLYASENFALRFGAEQVNYKNGGIPADSPYLLKTYYPGGLTGERLAQQLSGEADILRGEENVLHVSAQPSGPTYNNSSGYPQYMDVGFYVVLERVGGADEAGPQEPGELGGREGADPDPEPESAAGAAVAESRSDAASSSAAPSASTAQAPGSAAPSVPSVSPPPSAPLPPASQLPNMVEPEGAAMPLVGTPGVHWALLNLLLVLAAGMVALALAPGLFRRRTQAAPSSQGAEAGRRQTSAHRLWRLIALASFVAGFVVFLLTEDVRLPLSVVNRYTPLMLVFPIVAVFAAAMARGKKQSPDA